MRVFGGDVRDYESVFIQNDNSKKLYKRYFKYDKIQKPINFDSIAEFRDVFHDFLKTGSLDMWNNSVRLNWLLANFKVKGNYGTLSFKTSANVFSPWMRESVGINYDFLYQGFTYKALATYMDEVFQYPFQQNNPFKNPELYQYPFKFITVDFMMLVYQIPERMDLLRYADDKRMNFNAFADYVINYTSKCNFVDEEEMYEFRRNVNMGQTISFIKYKNYGQEEGTKE